MKQIINDVIYKKICSKKIINFLLNFLFRFGYRSVSYNSIKNKLIYKSNTVLSLHMVVQNKFFTFNTVFRISLNHLNKNFYSDTMIIFFYLTICSHQQC